MFNCHVCGHNAAKAEFVSEVFNLEGRRVLVENIPALVCEHCGEATFSRETTERIRGWFVAQTALSRPCRWMCLQWRDVSAWGRELDGLRNL